MSSAFIHAIELENELSENTVLKVAVLDKTMKIKTTKPEEKEERESPNIIVKEDLEDNEEPKEKEPEKYMYLDKDSITDGLGLSHEFGLCGDSNGKIYKIYICPYNLNKECELPFLEYLLELGNNTEYNFPYFQFVCPESKQTSFSFSNLWSQILGKQEPVEQDDVIDEMSAGHTYFMNQCLLRILEMIEIQDTEDPDLLVRIYKGFIEHGENSIYVIFDFTGLQLKETKANRRWAIMDEILVHHAILGYKINEELAYLFKENTFLTFITDENGIHIDLPSVLYICGLDSNGDYINLYQSDDKSTFSLFNERVNHPYLGNVYIFSLTPLPSSKGNVSRIRRFVGFTPDAEYVLTDIGKRVYTKKEAGEPEFLGFKLPAFLRRKEEESEQQESDQEESDHEESDQQESDQESDQEESDQEESEKDESGEQEPKKTSLTRKEIDNQLQQITNTSIYFQENKIPYWCIKSKLYFVEC
jgi:hypothetical protein